MKSAPSPREVDGLARSALDLMDYSDRTLKNSQNAFITGIATYCLDDLQLVLKTMRDWEGKKRRPDLEVDITQNIDKGSKDTIYAFSTTGWLFPRYRSLQVQESIRASVGENILTIPTAGWAAISALKASETTDEEKVALVDAVSGEFDEAQIEKISELKTYNRGS